MGHDNQWTESLQRFLKAFEKILNGFELQRRKKTDIFTHMVRIGAYELCDATTGVTEKETREFMRITGLYDKREKELFRQFITLVSKSVIEDRINDFLGAACNLVIGDGFDGDDFTSPDVAKLISELLIAPGMGATVVPGGGLRHLYEYQSPVHGEQGILISPVLLIGMDVNPVYVDAAYMQMSYRLQRGYLYHGNTITQEVYRKFVTPLQCALEREELYRDTLALLCGGECQRGEWHAKYPPAPSADL